MKIDMASFIPERIHSGYLGNTYPVTVEKDDDTCIVTYDRIVSNHTGGTWWRTHRSQLPEGFQLNKYAFESIGLLQGEMSKTLQRPFTFANSDVTVMNTVLDFFERAFCISRKEWRWYIRVNLPPSEETKTLKSHLTEHWIKACGLSREKQYPVGVSFCNNVQNKELVNNGTVMIERRGPVFIQTVHKLVRDITQSMPRRSEDELIPYMRGIIAAEGTINFKLSSFHRRVFITATNLEERNIFHKCLNRLGIETSDCSSMNVIIISQKKYLLKLKELNLLSLQKEKKNKFYRMINSYQE